MIKVGDMLSVKIIKISRGTDGRTRVTVEYHDALNEVTFVMKSLEDEEL